MNQLKQTPEAKQFTEDGAIEHGERISEEAKRISEIANAALRPSYTIDGSGNVLLPREVEDIKERAQL